MKLSAIKALLPNLGEVNFQLADGSFVPDHFHVTEVGQVTKHFIDCGGTIRTEEVVNFQLWNANDTEHRLKPTKLLRIIELSEEKLGIGDHETEVEYQGETIGRFDIGFNGQHFLLIPKNTACLASDACGAPDQTAEGSDAVKTKRSLSELTTSSPAAACCSPGGGCC